MAEPSTYTDLDARLERLIRQPQEDISAYLSTIKVNVRIASTKALAHCHMLAFDGNDRPRVAELAAYLGSIIIDYAIPRSKIQEAQERDFRENTTRNVSELKKKAKALFADVEKTGEGGELLLYLLTQNILKMPQILCKMSLKTSGKMHIHGTDGLHIKYDKSISKLALYWGESKLYADIDHAMADCLDSIKPYLVDDSKSANERDLQLFRDNLDLVDSDLEAELLNYLNPDHPNFNKMQFRGVCLIGFDDDRYPSLPNSKAQSVVENEIRESVANWSNKLKTKLISRSPLETFVLDIFLVPLPSVQIFRNAFLEEVKNA